MSYYPRFFTTLPYIFHAQLSETDYIQVTWLVLKKEGACADITYNPFASSTKYESGKPIKQTEFEEVFVKASDFLSERFEKMRGKKICIYLREL